MAVNRSKAAKKGARTRAANTRIAQFTQRRQEFESGSGAERVTSPVKPMGGEKLADAYQRLGLHDDAIHPLGQQELPGMSSLREARETGLMPARQEHPGHTDIGTRTLPDTPTPNPLWHEMSEPHRQRTLHKLAQYGVTPESMHQAFGTQLDQAHFRAYLHGSEPHAMRFYSDRSEAEDPDRMAPAQKLVASAKKNKVDLTTQAMADAITSPKQVFRRVPKSGPNKGKVTYPNDAMANIAVQGGQRIAEEEDFTHKDVSHPKGISGMVGNTRRAAHAVAQRLEGVDINEIRNPGGKKGPGGLVFGPKTGAYNNARVDPHSSVQRFVADIHSGGGGMAPHLSVDSPRQAEHVRTGKRIWVEPGGTLPRGHQWRDKSKPGEERSRAMKPVWGISERERILSIPGVHSLMDHVARNVLRERGLNSVSGGQAAQWGEERIRRGLEPEKEAFPVSKQLQHHLPGQGELW